MESRRKHIGTILLVIVGTFSRPIWPTKPHLLLLLLLPPMMMSMKMILDSVRYEPLLLDLLGALKTMGKGSGMERQQERGKEGSTNRGISFENRWAKSMTYEDCAARSRWRYDMVFSTLRFLSYLYFFQQSGDEQLPCFPKNQLFP